MKTTKEKIEIMQWFVDGGKVEYCFGDYWLETQSPSWNWSEKDYRKVEFTYPMWFKGNASNTVVKFTSLETGIKYLDGKLTSVASIWAPHTYSTAWTQIEDPTIVKIPKIERRWIWLRDHSDFTQSSEYLDDRTAKACSYEANGWYKSQMFIDVEIKE